MTPLGLRPRVSVSVSVPVDMVYTKWLTGGRSKKSRTYKAQGVGKIDGRDSLSVAVYFRGRRDGRISSRPNATDSSLSCLAVSFPFDLGLDFGLFHPDRFDEPFDLADELVALNADVRRLAEVRFGQDLDLKAVEKAFLVRLVRLGLEVRRVPPIPLEFEQRLPECEVQGVVFLRTVQAVRAAATGEEVPLTGEEGDGADFGQLGFPRLRRRGEAEPVSPCEEEEGCLGRRVRFRDKSQVRVAAVRFRAEGVVAGLAHDSHADLHGAGGRERLDSSAPEKSIQRDPESERTCPTHG